MCMPLSELLFIHVKDKKLVYSLIPYFKFFTSLTSSRQDLDMSLILFYMYIFLGGLECVGHSFAYVAHFVFLP
jgi:hypothetical protein